MDLNKADRLILAKLIEGRCTPSYLSKELSKSQPYISQRLNELKQEGLVIRVHRGLYEHGNQENTVVDPTNKIKNKSDEELIEPFTTGGESQDAESPGESEESNGGQDSPDEVVEVEADEFDSAERVKRRGKKEEERTGEWESEFMLDSSSDSDSSG